MKFKLTLILLFLVAAIGAARADDLYKKGVEAYLNGETKKAVYFLQSVLADEPDNDKAKQLLQKLLSKREPAKKLKVEPQQKIMPAPAPKPVKKASPPAKPVVVKAIKAKPRPAPAPRPARIEKKHPAQTAQKKKDGAVETVENEPPVLASGWMTAFIAGGFLAMIGLMFLCYVLIFQSRNIKSLVAQNASLRESLKREHSDRSRLQFEKEIEKKVEKKAEDLFLKWKEKERKNHPPPSPPAMKPIPVRSVSTPVPSVPRQEMSNKKKMISALVDIPNAKRRSAWEHIAAEMEDIHRLNPTEASRLFSEMASDPNPWVRAGMAGALRAVADDESVQILLRLGNDSDPNVQREALKQIKSLAADPGMPEHHKAAIRNLMDGEIERGEWII